MSRIIVCGFSQLGYRIATLLLDLREQVVLVTLEGRDEWVRTVQGRGAELVIGDARDEKILESCGISDAKAIITCTDDDSVNIEIALDARRLSSTVRIVTQIFDDNLAHQLEIHLGVDKALALSTAAAPAFAAAAFGDRALSEIVKGEMRMLVLRVPGPQRLDSAPLVLIDREGQIEPGGRREIAEGETAVVLERTGTQGMNARRTKPFRPLGAFRLFRGIWRHASAPLRTVLALSVALMVVSVAVFKVGLGLSPVDAIYFVVATVTTTGYGDINLKDASDVMKLYASLVMLLSAASMAILFTMVTDYLVTARLMQLTRKHRVPEKEHVVVVGIGSVGFRTVHELLRLGAEVVAIDGSEDNEQMAGLRGRVAVIIGDARDPVILREAGVDKAKSVIATSPKDAVNLSVGLAAREMNRDVRLVLRIFEPEFAAKVQALTSIDAALSASRLAAPAFVGAALYGEAVASFRLGPRFFTLVDDPAGDVHLAGERMSLRVRELWEA